MGRESYGGGRMTVRRCDTTWRKHDVLYEVRVTAGGLLCWASGMELLVDKAGDCRDASNDATARWP